MDLLNKLNTLVSTSTQAVEDTRRIFSEIEKVVKVGANGEAKEEFSVLALTDLGFSDPSFVQMEIKKEYMRTLRKRVCEYFDGESADVTVYFARHKKNRKCREVKINRYVKYLLDGKLSEKKKKTKKKKHHKKKKHCCDSDDESDCDSDEDSDEDSDCDSDEDSDDSDCDEDSDDEYNNININVKFVKYNDLNQYRKLTGEFDKFYIGKQDLVTNVYYQKLMTAVNKYTADVKNADNVAALSRIGGVDDLKNVVTKDMRPGKHTQSGKLVLSYGVNELMKMHPGIYDIPQQMVFNFVVTDNLF